MAPFHRTTATRGSSIMNIDRPSNAGERHHMSNASWRPDPIIRSRSRYWGGERWTSNVAEPGGGQSGEPGMRLRSGFIGFGLAVVLVAGCGGTDAADVGATADSEPTPSSITTPAPPTVATTVAATTTAAVTTPPTDAATTTLAVTTPPTDTSQENRAVETDGNIDTGNTFVEAFYAFDAATLGNLLTESDSDGLVLFYQGWAEGANYAVLERHPCETVTATEIRCSTTVEDDLIKALGLDFKVTDTFNITFDQAGTIVIVSLSTDDPPEGQAALAAVIADQPELFGGVCQGFFDGGPTPGECARAFVASFEARAG